MFSTIARAGIAARLASLLGSASFTALAATGALAAAAAPQIAPVEEVLITGSLIRGAPTVGVPITALGQEDFRETGALTVADMLYSLPSLEVEDSVSIVNGGRDINRGQNVSIHGLGTGDGSETLMLINGFRYPTQSTGVDLVDPSIIPQLAVQRIDVLADGASATYGSDAVAGVINVILKRRFDGAITQLRAGMSTSIGAPSFQFAQQYGRTWDTGAIVLTYEFYDEEKVVGTKRDYFTYNFEPYGLGDTTPLASNMPGILTTGSPLAAPGMPSGFSPNAGTRFCANCYSIPQGSGWDFDSRAPGATTSWTALLANKGVLNQRNPYEDAWMLPQHQRNAVVLTFDQELLPWLDLFVDGFYTNRRSVIYYPAGSSPGRENWTSGNGITVPTSNPYYPTGAPSGLRIHYTLGPESPLRTNAGELAGRYAFGFDAELPYDWTGRVYYSMSESQHWAHTINMINRANFSAALGNLVPAVPASGTTPGQQAFTKPANVPYLNVFCDATVYECNSPATLKYIRAFRDNDEKWKIGETGINLEGPVFTLPGGDIRAAIGANKVSHHFSFISVLNFSTPNNAIIVPNRQYETPNVWAVMGEVNVPIFGEANAIPLIERLVFTAAYRIDKYDYLDEYVKTPKLGVDWGLGYGLTLHGNWGTAFRAPGFAESSQFTGSRINAINTLAGASANTVETNCASVTGSPSGVALPGSVTFALNPTCIGGVGSTVPDPTGQFSRPGGLLINGGAALSTATIRPDAVVGPQSATTWAVGGTFAPPDGVLAGFFASATYFNIKVEDLLSIDTSGSGVNDPLSIGHFLVINDPTKPITDPVNAEFLAAVQRSVGHSRSDVDPTFIPNIKFILDETVTNIGYMKISGIDFDTRYDWQMGNLGSWNIGFRGLYKLTREQQALPSSPVDDSFVGKNSGHRLRGRGRLGWTDGIWDATLFVNYFPHGAVDDAFTPQSCYWLTGNAAGSCYPGSTFVGPHDVFPNRSPEQYLFDISIGYQTGDRPANPYLKNINVQFNVQNVTDRRPPFHYDTRSSSGSPHAFDRGFNPLQRRVSIAVSKVW